MAVTTEIAPDIYRSSIFAPRNNLQFNHLSGEGRFDEVEPSEIAGSLCKI